MTKKRPTKKKSATRPNFPPRLAVIRGVRVSPWTGWGRDQVTNAR